MLQRDRQRQRERGTFSGGGAGAFTAEYLVVAGGGGGSTRHSGGGGAGGYRSSVAGESSGGGASSESALNIALGTPYTVTVGAGGGTQTNTSPPAPGGNPGSNSVFSTITSFGGGGGGGDNYAPTADGGSGGGGGYLGNYAGSGTAGQGYDGGYGTTFGSAYHGGGGGGAGQVGGNAVLSTRAGNGGNGVQSYITGSAIYRAGGGGGSSFSHPGGAGGLGGGGNGGGGVGGQSGTANTGGGGGAGGGGAGASGAGGSGVVIIRVPSTVVAEFSAGVVYNYIPQDDFNVYEITAAGVSDTVTFSQGAVTTVGESLLFNDNDGAYLTRTPASAGDRKTWTWSAWVKRGNLGTAQTILGAGNVSTNEANLSFSVDDTIEYFDRTGGTALDAYRLTTATFRDPSAWYHFVLALNTTSGTASERIKLYVNGKQITDFSSAVDPVLNYESNFSNNVVQYIGKRGFNLQYFDGYLSDVYFIDGEALDPSRFGKQDADGIWQPISYTGSYGTNGFHLDFADNSTAAALGTDTSGNGNDWTPSGITTDDQVTDTPSVNYATLNSIDKDNNATLSEGNLKVASNGAGNSPATFFLTSGKWYWEAQGTGYATGVAGEDGKNYAGSISVAGSKSIGHWSGDGRIYWDGGSAAGSAAYTASDVMAVALDMDAGTVAFYKNNTLVYTATFGSGTVPDISAGVFPVHNNGDANSRSVTYNFGQRPFAYTPPTGFQALNSSNLPAPTITDGKAHFQPALYTGNGTTQFIGGLEQSPDFVWVKERNSTEWHQLYDALRGTGALHSNDTAAETAIGGVTLGTNGFTVSDAFRTNQSGSPYVAWTWNAGGSTVTNTDGTITSQVRANTDAGISIVSYSQGASGATVGHGLGAAPDIVIAKSRTVAGPNWAVYHSSIGKDLVLELSSTSAAISLANYWGASTPSSTTFGVATTGFANNTGDMIAYCFAEVDGFSKFGTYTGNGSADGPFVYTGFRPAFVMVKRTDAANSWLMMDDKRSPYNYADEILWADLSDAEALGGTNTSIDFLSNGFKARGNGGSINTSGGTYIFMAFAENPFKTARAR